MKKKKEKASMFLTWSQISSHFFSLSYCRSNLALSGGRFIAFCKEKKKKYVTSHNKSNRSLMGRPKNTTVVLQWLQLLASDETETPYTGHLNIKLLEWEEIVSEVLYWDTGVVCSELQTFISAKVITSSLNSRLSVFSTKHQRLLRRYCPNFLFQA